MSGNVWTPGSNILLVTADNTIVRDNITATEGQSLFSLTKFVYTVGSGALHVYLNGVYQRLGIDFVENASDSFSFISADIHAGDTVTAVGYVALEASPTRNVAVADQAFTATQGQTVFTVTHPSFVADNGSLAVFLNGLRVRAGIEYTVVSNVITFIETLAAGDYVIAVFNSEVGIADKLSIVDPVFSGTISGGAGSFSSLSISGITKLGTYGTEAVSYIQVAQHGGAIGFKNSGVSSANRGLTFGKVDLSGTYTGCMMLDDSGNLGIGVTPSTWNQGKALELSGVGQGLWGNSTGDIWVVNNCYYNGGWKFAAGVGTAKATYYRQGAGLTVGTDTWGYAGSGTAGGSFTFTDAMTLDASGNLLVGTTNINGLNTTGFEFLTYTGTANSSSLYIGHQSGESSGTKYLGFNYAGGSIGSITQNGTTAVAYNTTSDHRLKENVRPANAARFNDIEFVDFEWIDGRHDCGVIAHQLQSVYPDLVLGNKDAVDEEGKPVYQQVNYTGLIARMGTRIQLQDKAISELESRLAALEGVK